MEYAKSGSLFAGSTVSASASSATGSGPAGSSTSLRLSSSSEGVRPSDGLHSHAHVSFALVGPPVRVEEDHLPTLVTPLDAIYFVLVICVLVWMRSRIVAPILLRLRL